ncbi:zinc ribbon domain-containing protein [Bifidobacterium leontopitheci]|uniref:FadF n=1 Tax=Bifidobacterium leontopitheci TaxID=2650774 RepID=A0A6I1GHK0_9BIFI|nr:zinc ribbon domain-containing protein [Bifidobacterium leontopitheci]KAB7791123.1 fadF [Bifidobacterium leontopitheci]
MTYAAMTCAQCGNVLEQGARFCTFCGTPVTAAAPTAPAIPAPPSPNTPATPLPSPSSSPAAAAVPMPGLPPMPDRPQPQASGHASAQPVTPPAPAVPLPQPVATSAPSAAAADGNTHADDHGKAKTVKKPGKPNKKEKKPTATGGTRKRRIIIGTVIAVVALAIAAILAVVFLIILPGQKVGFNAIVHAAGPDSPKLCRNLLGDDKAMSKAFGYTVTATDPGDKADTGVCIYNDDARKPHTIRIGYATSNLGGDAVVKAASSNGRYVIAIDKDPSITPDAASRLQRVFGKAANRLKDDTTQWAKALPKLESGMTVIPNQTVCEGRACNGMPSDGSPASSGTSESGSSGDGTSDGSASGDGTSSGNAAATTFPAAGNDTPTVHAYDTSLAVLDHPKAVKTKLTDGTVTYAVPADGETFALLDFRRAPANRCTAQACTWQSDASKSATITIGGKSDKGADNVLKGVVANSAPAHGTFVVSAKPGVKARITVNGGGGDHEAQLSLDAASGKTDVLEEAAAKKTAVDAAGKQGNACDRGCTATGVVTFDHPVWGRSTLVTLAMGSKAKTYDGDMGVARYDAGFGYVVVSQSGQAMYGNFVLDPILDDPSGPHYSRYNLLPAMNKPDKSGNILLAAYDYPGGSATADYAIAFHVGAGGDLQGIGFGDDSFGGGIRPLILNAGDVDKDGNADVTIAYGVDSGDGTAANAWRVDYRWSYDKGKGSYQPTQVETSENSALTNAYITTNVLYNSESMSGAHDIIVHQLSDDAEIFSWDSCQVKKVSEVEPFDYNQVGGGTAHADDPVDFSVGLNLYFLAGTQNPKPMDNLLAQGNKEFCSQAHSTGMGGIGGAGYPTASLQATSQSYDAKTRTAKMTATINWSYPSMYGFDSPDPAPTTATITIKFDKDGKLLRVDTTSWGAPRNY